MHQEIKTCVICERTQDEIESQVINPEYDMQVLLTFSVMGKKKCVCVIHALDISMDCLQKGMNDAITC